MSYRDSKAMKTTRRLPSIPNPPRPSNQISNNQLLNFTSIDSLQKHHPQKYSPKTLYKQTDKTFLQMLKKLSKNQTSKYAQALQNQRSNLTPEQYNELDYKGRIHGRAQTINENSNLCFDAIPKIDRCQCGCGRGKGKLIPLWRNEQEVEALGSGTLLLFLFGKAAVLMLLLIIVVYGIFAIITNSIGTASDLLKICNQDTYCKFKVIISDENKHNTPTLIQIQQWLGVLFCIIWIFSTKLLKLQGSQKDRILDLKLKTSSDTTIKIQNLPNSKYEQRQIIAHLQQLWRRRMEKKREDRRKRMERKGVDGGGGGRDQTDQYRFQSRKSRLGMKSIQIVYDMGFVRKFNQEIFRLAQEVASYFVVQDNKTQPSDLIQSPQSYTKSKQKLVQIYKIFQDVRKRFFNDAQFRKKLSSTCCLLQFNNNWTLNAFIKEFGSADRFPFLKKLQLWVRDVFVGGGAERVLFKNSVLRIERAPEPSDILWVNCQKPQSDLKRLGISVVALLVIVGSFFGIFGLGFLQLQIKRNPTLIPNTSITTLLQYSTSLILLFTNFILWQIMPALTKFQQHHTKTNHIISQIGFMNTFTCLNIILIPIITNFIKFKYYGDNMMNANDGLSGICLQYHILLIFTTWLDLLSLGAIRMVLVWYWKWARDWIIWLYYGGTEAVIGGKGDPEVNKLYEGIQFDFAQSYVSLLSSIIHAAFFCKLQPAILIFTTIHICIFLLINRIKIYRMCKIPDLTNYLVFSTATRQLSLIPIYYGVGNIVTSYLHQLQNPTLPSSLLFIIAPMCCIGLGVLGLLNPWKVFTRILVAFVRRFRLVQMVEMGEDGNEGEQGEQGEDRDSEDDSQSQSQGGSQSVIRDGLTNDRIYGGEGKSRNDRHNRIESYYMDSNSLSLFQLQTTLKQNSNENSYKYLKFFCQSFFTPQISLDEQVKPPIRNESTIFELKQISMLQMQMEMQMQMEQPMK